MKFDMFSEERVSGIDRRAFCNKNGLRFICCNSTTVQFTGYKEPKDRMIVNKAGLLEGTELALAWKD
jgi:hypothetical protein